MTFLPTKSALKVDTYVALILDKSYMNVVYELLHTITKHQKLNIQDNKSHFLLILNKTL